LADDKGEPTTGQETLNYFKRLITIPAGFTNVDETSHANPITEMLFTPDGYLITSFNGERSAQAWDIVTGEPVRTTPNYKHPVKFETITFYDGRHKTITLKNGSIYLPYNNDYSILTSGAWSSIKNKELTQVAGAVNGSRTRLIAVSDRQGRIYVTHTTLTLEFSTVITRHGSELVFLNWAGPKYQGTSAQAPRQSWLTTHLTSASLDGTIRIWDVEHEQELGCFMGHDVANPAIAENDIHFAYADQHGYVHVFERLGRKC
jgi:WD40 repeat protein